ncbi:MAG: 2-amino-4-hydroxy-6-hydroxymethyldihydropteridine diphosphokinase [Planctomycetota bacterium]
MKAYLSLGSNLDPEDNLRAAAVRLRALGGAVRFSGVYESPPQGGARGPDFLNAAAIVESTALDAHGLKGALRAIEAELGRIRPASAGEPRTIDLDIISLDGSRPHPDLERYAHVAVPLRDVAPEFTHAGESVAEIASRLEAGSSLRLREDVVL